MRNPRKRYEVLPESTLDYTGEKYVLSTCVDGDAAVGMFSK